MMSMLKLPEYPSRKCETSPFTFRAPKYPLEERPSLHRLIIRLISLLDDLRRLRDLLPENMSLDKVWKPHGQLMGDEVLRWDRENLCQGR